MKINNCIFHIDMDSFFPSVEEIKNSKLKGKPIVVGGNDNGVVSSSNYVARNFGVKSAMPIYIAKKLCKELIVIKITEEHMRIYQSISENIFRTLEKKITRNIEIGSIDEWYLNVSGEKFAHLSEVEIASLIKKTILQEYQLNCSIGCSYNKFLAKMATNFAKPNGFFILDKDNFKEKIWDFPIEKMIHVGNSAQAKMKEKGIFKIRDIAQYPNDQEMIKIFGINWIKFKNNANGRGINDIDLNNNKKSIGKSQSIEKIIDFDEAKIIIDSLIKKLNYQLEKYELSYLTVSCSIKTNQKNAISKSKTFHSPHYQIKNEDIYKMFKKNMEKVNFYEIKNISINLHKIEDVTIQEEQISWINNSKNNDEKNEIEKIINKINKQFKKRIVYKLKQ